MSMQQTLSRASSPPGERLGAACWPPRVGCDGGPSWAGGVPRGAPDSGALPAVCPLAMGAASWLLGPARGKHPEWNWLCRGSPTGSSRIWGSTRGPSPSQGRRLLAAARWPGRWFCLSRGITSGSLRTRGSTRSLTMLGEPRLVHRGPWYVRAILELLARILPREVRLGVISPDYQGRLAIVGVFGAKDAYRKMPTPSGGTRGRRRAGR